MCYPPRRLSTSSNLAIHSRRGDADGNGKSCSEPGVPFFDVPVGRDRDDDRDHRGGRPGFRSGCVFIHADTFVRRQTRPDASSTSGSGKSECSRVI